jgi:hypothetical protein
MVKRMRRVLLYLLVASCLLLDGCQGDPYYSSYTHAEPNKSDLVGTWVPDENTLKDLRTNGGYDISKATTKLMLGAEGASNESQRGFASRPNGQRNQHTSWSKSHKSKERRDC